MHQHRSPYVALSVGVALTPPAAAPFTGLVDGDPDGYEWSATATYGLVDDGGGYSWSDEPDYALDPADASLWITL